MMEARVLFAVIDAIWQGIAIAALAGLLLRLVRTNAATRCAVWSAVLIVVALLPIANAISLGARFAAAVQTPLAVQPQAPRAGEAVVLTRPVRAARAADEKSVPPAANVAKPFVLDVTAGALRAILAGLFAVALLRAAFLLVGYLRLRRLVADATPFERSLPLPIRRKMRVATSPSIAVPVAVGLGDPVILLPSAIVGELSDEDLDHVLLHEAAHLARHDDLMNAFERFAGAVLFFHPAVHIAARRIDIEREIACDDWVIAATGRRHPYAFCLTKLAEFALSSTRRSMPALGLFANGRALRLRVEHLLDATAVAFPGRSRFALVAVVLIVASALALAAMRLPVVAGSNALPHSKATRAPAPRAKAVVKPQARATQAPPSFERRQIIVVHPTVRLPAADSALVARRPIPLASVSSTRVEYAVARENLAIEVAQAETSAPVASPPPTAPSPSVHIPAIHIPAIRIPEINAREIEISGAGPEVLRGTDYRNRDLRNANFVHKALIDVDFRGADLRGAHFDGSILRAPKLAGAKLAGASFVGASISNCACANLDLTGAHFDGASLRAVDLSRALLRNAHLVGASLRDCDLSGSSFAGATLVGASLSRIKLANADFSQANLTGASLRGVDLTGVNLRGATMEGISIGSSSGVMPAVLP